MITYRAVGGGGGDATLNALFDVLADNERRALLEAFLDRDDDDWTLEGAVATLAADSESETDDHLGLRLHHVHLPKLADAGLLEYDPMTRSIRGTTALGVVEPYLRVATAQTDRRGRLVVGAGGRET
jgi:hypothetical protein